MSLSLNFISISFKNKNKRKIRELSKNVSFNTFNRIRECLDSLTKRLFAGQLSVITLLTTLSDFQFYSRKGVNNETEGQRLTRYSQQTVAKFKVQLVLSLLF